MQEIGFPGVGTLAWQAMFARPAPRRPILETVHKPVAAGHLQAPSVVEAGANMACQASVPTPGNPISCMVGTRDTRAAACR